MRYIEMSDKLDEIFKEVYSNRVGDFTNQQTRMLRLRYPGKSNEEIRAIVEENQNKRKLECDKQDLRHSKLIELNTIIGAIARLHSPDNHYRTCTGCDYAGYEAEQPDWPCRTWELIANYNED